MFRRILILTTLTTLSIWFSLASFQSESKACRFDANCANKVMKKYTVWKDAACLMKDGFYNNPLIIKRSNVNETAHNFKFYKHKGILYYPVLVISNNIEDNVNRNEDSVNWYFYSYVCQTKKTKSLDVVLPGKTIDMKGANGDQILLIDKIKFWDEVILKPRLLNITNISIDDLTIKSFKWFDAYDQYIKWQIELIFNSTKEKTIGFQDTKVMWWNIKNILNDSNLYNGSFYWLKVDYLNNSLRWLLKFNIRLWDKTMEIKWARIDFSKKTITFDVKKMKNIIIDPLKID